MGLHVAEAAMLQYPGQTGGVYLNVKEIGNEPNLAWKINLQVLKV